MNTEIKQAPFRVRRQKNRILIHLAGLDIGPLRPDLVIVLTKDGGIAVDRKWHKEIETQAIHTQAWRDLLSKLDLPFLVCRKLDAAPPPRSVAQESVMVKYLRDIACGKMPVKGLGRQGKDVLTQSLRAAFPGRVK